MASRTDIEKLVAAIAREFQPQRIILFGSYAYGQPRPDSDVDLLVIKPVADSPAREALRILERLKPRFGVDLMVRSQEDLRQRLAWNDPFLHEVTRQGKTLYDTAD